MKFLHRFYRQKKQTPSAYSLVDVGRHTVKAAVILMIPGTAEPQIVGYGLAETGGHDVTGGRIEADAVTRPVNEALTQAEDSTERFVGQKIVPDDVILILAGQATIGKLFTVKQTRAKPAEPISAKELNSLRARAERLVREGLTFSSFEGGQWLPIAVTDAGRHLDGRLVLDGVGLTGSEISFSVFGVAGQASALRALEVLANRLDLVIANIVASPHALASISPHKEAIILDIGHSGTNVCLIKNDTLVATDWTPFGGRFFTQALVREKKLDSAAAKALKHAYAKGDLAREEAIEIEAYLDGPCYRWYDAVLELLTELSYGQPLPRRIWMTGGASLLPGLEKLLRTNHEPFDSAPEISQLGRGLPLAVKDLTDSLDYNLFALTLSSTIGLPELP
jgi:cell division ATPase FtsA